MHKFSYEHNIEHNMVLLKCNFTLVSAKLVSWTLLHAGELQLLMSHTLHTHVVNSLCVLSTQMVYSQLAHAKCLHMWVSYTDMWVPYTWQWPHMLYLYQDIYNKQAKVITHLSVYPTHPYTPSFFLETKKWKFTHLMWCTNLYYYRCSFKVAAYNIWWVSIL